MILRDGSSLLSRAMARRSLRLGVRLLARSDILNRNIVNRNNVPAREKPCQKPRPKPIEQEGMPVRWDIGLENFSAGHEDSYD
jgi:hypothetical protein